jgi:uncharacterized coiled-coil DUF342 family protein
LAEPAAVALAFSLFGLAVITQRDEITVSADVKAARAQLATAQQELEAAKSRRAALAAEVSELEPLAQSPAAAPANAPQPPGPSAAPAPGASPAGNARDLILQLQQQVRQRTEERAQLQQRRTELEPQLLQSLPARLANSRQSLAQAGHTWQQLETEAKAFPQTPRDESGATNPLQQALQTTSTWQTRLAEQDRLLAQFKVTPASLSEADQLVQTTDQVLVKARSDTEAVRTGLADLRQRTQALTNRLTELRQALADARQTWQQLEAEAKAFPQAPRDESGATNPLQQALQTTSTWQTRLAEQDRLLAQFKVTPASLSEADRLFQSTDDVLGRAQAEAGNIRSLLANRSLPAALRSAFAAPSGATDSFGNPVVKRQGRDTDPAGGWPLEIVHQASGLVLVLVPAGQFQMGSPANEAGRGDDEGPVHLVRFQQPFYMSKYEVTQDQWQKVMGDNPSYFKGDARRPVEQVSWQDAQRLVGKLNESLAGAAGWRFGLPSEAQWEYACRAGSTTRYAFGDDASQLGEYAWYSANSGNSTHPVGQTRTPKLGAVFERGIPRSIR